ncbi:MAG: DUF1566 domain-containing protein [Candidatus Kapaibacterium sp.]
MNYSVIFPQSYKIVDTGVEDFYDDYNAIPEPMKNDSFFGQDANYRGNQPDYTDNGDGTVSDNVTGLMWQKEFAYIYYADAESDAAAATTGGYSDWRVPTIKELYSLILFTGNQGSAPPETTTPPEDAVPFMNTEYFDFEYPSENRYIDAQYISSSEYSGRAINNDQTFFGVNFADGRIKAYPMEHPMLDRKYYARFVRGNPDYGKNDFVDNGNGTITDAATGLTWLKYDSGDSQFAEMLAGYTNTDGSMNWEEALEFCVNLEFGGFDDWRLPNAKELQSILDYSRGPDATNSAAIDPAFEVTPIVNEAGDADYPAFWASTSFAVLDHYPDAVIVNFGRAMGYIDGHFIDVHGAGCQRTDPKAGEPSYGFGPQGDVRRVYNYVRPVRGGAELINSVDVNYDNGNKLRVYPNPASEYLNISLPDEKFTGIDLIIENMLGQAVAEYELTIDAPRVDASGLAPGMYIIKLISGGEITYAKFIKE